MTTDDELGRRTREAVLTLRSSLDPDRVVLDGAELHEAAAVWNGAVDHRPALVVRCGSTDDVRAALRAARAHGLPLSVRVGGHDWTGRAIRPGALVIDLRRMRRVSLRGTTATVGGGTTVREVAEAADRAGLAAVTGSSGGTGMAGLTLGAGTARSTAASASRPTTC